MFDNKIYDVTRVNADGNQPKGNDQKGNQHTDRGLVHCFGMTMPVMIPDGLIECDLKNPKEEDDIHQAAEEQGGHKAVLTRSR